MDPVEFMLLNRIANTQADIAYQYQDQIASLRNALLAERQRNAEILEMVGKLKNHNSTLDTLTKVWKEAYAKLKGEKDGLEDEVSTLRSRVAERDQAIRLHQIQRIFDQAMKHAYSTQIEALKADTPGSSLREVADVPGHPDLPRRSGLRLVFDEAYSAYLRKAGVTPAHLKEMADAGWTYPEPVFLDREPAAASSEEHVATPTP